MSSVSFSPLSPWPLQPALPDRAQTLGPLGSPSSSAGPPSPVERPAPTKATGSSANAGVDVPAVTLPSTVDMRFEFNALTQAWLLAMTDSASGEVVRKMDLKGFTRGASEGLHVAGHAVDQKV